MTEPSVLAYARYFNLVQEYSQHDILRCLDIVQIRDNRAKVNEFHLNQCSELIDSFASAAKEYISLANDEALQISQDVAEFLESSTCHKKPDMTQVYRNLLPDHRKFEKLKVDLPLLQIGGGDVRRDVQKIKQGVDFDLVLDEMLESYGELASNSKSSVSQPIITSDDAIRIVREHLEGAVQNDVLKVTVDILNFLKDAIPVKLEDKKRFEFITSTLPKSSPATFAHHVLREDDFDSSGTDEGSSHSTEDAHVQLDDLGTSQVSVKQEAGNDLLYKLDVAVDQEINIFETATQQDKDIDDLFEQFIDNDIEMVIDNSWAENNASSNGIMDNRLLSKPDYPEPAHHIIKQVSNKTTKDEKGVIASQYFENLKLDIPQICPQPIRMPELELDMLLDKHMLATNLEIKPLTQKIQINRPPFSTPTIQDVLRDSKTENNLPLEKFLKNPKQIITSRQLLWKKPGLRILDQEDEINRLEVDDFYIDTSIADSVELTDSCQSSENSGTKIEAEDCRRDEDSSQPTNFRPKFSSESTVRDTKLELGKNSIVNSDSGLKQRSSNALTSPDIYSIVYDNKERRESAVECSETTFNARKSHSHLSPITEQPDFLFVSDSLSGFLELKGRQFKRELGFRKVRAEEIADDPIESTQHSVSHDVLPLVSDKTTRGQEQLSVPVPAQDILPRFTPLTSLRSIVVNNSLLKHKPLLVQFLERHTSNTLSLIYRDLDVSENKGPDIILNAKSCLLITGLQSLSQRLLPGQRSATSLSSVHDQIATLAQAYQSTYILVYYLVPSHQNIVEKITEEQSQFVVFCQTWSKVSFASSKSIFPIWIPCIKASAISDMVNAWVWRVINKYAYPAISINSTVPIHESKGTPLTEIIGDETLWELFLVQAGLNTIAAQLVIGSLKQRLQYDPDGVGTCPEWGLRRLVSMGAEERHVVFDGRIGRDVVERLNQLLKT